MTRDPAPSPPAARQRPDDGLSHPRAARLQTAGRALLLAFVLAGALGLLGGNGPTTLQIAPLASGGALQIPRFVRHRSPFEMTLAVPPGGGEPVTLRFSTSLAEAVSIDRTWPQPVDSRWDKGGLVLTFPPGTTRATLRAYPLRVGPLDGLVSLQDQRPRRVRLWGYP